MAWTAKRSALSAFLVAHLAAVAIGNLPSCALKQKVGGWADAYLLPTGLWQGWGMFAPEPPKNTLTLEAVVRDSAGLIRPYAFPRTMDRSAWDAMTGFRHAKYANLVGGPTAVANREFAARFVVRALDLKPSDYPADVQLLYQVWPTIAPDAPPDEPPAPPWQSVIATYRFETPAEALP